jgi:hypothetical protein
MCNPDSLSKLFESASLADVTVRALDMTTRFENFDDYWQPLLTGQGSAPNYLARRDESTRSAIRERLRDSIPADPSGAIELPARAWGVRGRH